MVGRTKNCSKMKAIIWLFCCGFILTNANEAEIMSPSLQQGCTNAIATKRNESEQTLTIGLLQDVEEEANSLNSTGVYLLEVPKDGRLKEFQFQGIFNDSNPQNCSLQFLIVTLFRINSNTNRFILMEGPLLISGGYNEVVRKSDINWNLQENDNIGIITRHMSRSFDNKLACPSQIALETMECLSALYSPSLDQITELNKDKFMDLQVKLNLQYTIELNTGSNYIRTVVGTISGFLGLICLGSILVFIIGIIARKYKVKKKAASWTCDYAINSLGATNPEPEDHEYQYIHNVQVETAVVHNYEKHVSVDPNIRNYEKPVSVEPNVAQSYESIELVESYVNPASHKLLNMTVDSYFPPASSENDIISQLTDDIKIPILQKNDLSLGKELGCGAFGKVYKAAWYQKDASSDTSVEQVVAVKTIDKEVSHDDTVTFLQEAATMAQFNCHPGIISILGVVLEPQVMIIIDIMEGGDLQNHLINNFRKNLHNTDIQEIKGLLLSYTRQMCCAMTFLEKKGYIHRDLAARNILVTSDGYTVKISDFGLSRELQSDCFYLSHGGKVPVRWTAPEALQYRLYSSGSDMWSYGCVLYEIWSLGHKPFHDMKNAEVLNHIMKGNRLAPPPGCPKAIYQLMITCWHPDAAERGSFRDLAHSLLKPDFMVLKWSKEDLNRYDKEMLTIGAPLENGRELFKTMQKTYCDHI